jgi:hypothetical protein
MSLQNIFCRSGNNWLIRVKDLQVSDVGQQVVRAALKLTLHANDLHIVRHLDLASRTVTLISAGQPEGTNKVGRADAASSPR